MDAKRHALTFFALSSLLLACDGAKTPSGPPVVVYASEDDPASLSELFTAFTTDTGIPVAVQWGNSAENTAAVIDKAGLPADVLITPNVTDIWRAADEGALRPISGGAIDAVRGELKGADKLWVALEVRFAVTIASPKHAAVLPGDYQALATPAYRDKLCLSSVENSVNRVVIAMLIEDIGLKSAERVVKGWVANLSHAPFDTEASLLEALASGQCQFAIISDTVATVDAKSVGPVPLYYDISGMGVGRHAQSAERAQQLLEWLITNHPLRKLPETNGRNIGAVGWRNPEVLLLADRVGYR